MFGRGDEDYFQLQFASDGSDSDMDYFGVTINGGTASSLDKKPRFKVISMDGKYHMPQKITTYEFDIEAQYKDVQTIKFAFKDCEISEDIRFCNDDMVVKVQFDEAGDESSLVDIVTMDLQDSHVFYMDSYDDDSKFKIQLIDEDDSDEVVG